MKSTKPSFLFFVIIVSALLYSNSTTSQIKNDSTSYYYNLVYNTKESTDLLKANKFYNSLYNHAIKEGDTLNTINTLRIIASIQFKLSAFYESESAAVEAIKLLDHIKVTNNTKAIRIGLNNHLGLNYNALYNYEKAIEYYNKNLELELNANDLVTTINNKALALDALGNNKLALLEFKKAYERSLLTENKKIQARALDNLGFAQSKQNIPEGVKNMNLALKMRQSLDYKPGIYTSYNHLARYYNQIGDFQRANRYSDQAMLIARKINSPKYLENALSTSLRNKNIDQLTEYITLKDSLAKAAQMVENKNASAKYNYHKYEKTSQENKLKLQQSELDKEKEKSNRIMFQAIAVLLILSIVFIVIRLKDKHKKEKLQQVYQTESRISKKVHDEVANDIYKVMTKIQSAKNMEESVLDDLENIYARTRDISKENNAIDLKGNFNTLLNDLLLGYKNNDVNVITKGSSKVDWNKIPDIKKTTLYRVLQELMTNMRKHSKASIVVLNFNQSYKKTTITYTDNGIGCSIAKANGLQNVENRIHSIEGKINFDSSQGNGFKATIVI